MVSINLIGPISVSLANMRNNDTSSILSSLLPDIIFSRLSENKHVTGSIDAN